MFGLNIYVVAAIGLSLIGLGGYGAYQYQRAEAATAREESAQALAAQYKQDLAESEADKALLRDANKRLDQAIRVRDARLADLERAKRNLDAEYQKLKAAQSKEDQDCLDRALPPAYVERLRNGGADKNGVSEGARAGSPAVAVPDQ